jgi:type IV secretory pathway TraG/TraD family ATPase VirD4
VNPFRGIFISGGAGSGKSYSLANPIIRQAVGKGYCGLVYDFKFPVLCEQVNKALVLSGNKEVTHYIVNFYDLSRSHRLNPLRPENMPTVAYAEEYALAILNNLLPESIRKKDFWIRSANAILTAVIWFLKKHHPQHCTLPHVVNTILYKDYLHVMSMLETDAQCSDMVRSALTAMENEAESQVAGVMGTLQISIVRINSPEICWVLSGDDFDLDLNNPSHPKLLTLGSHPTLSDTFSPVISCIATVALKLMNQPGKRHSLVLLDEAPTIYIPKLDMIPATARSNKVATIYMAQDFSQMVFSYGKEAAEVVISNLNNQLYGRVGSLATAKHVSELFGKEEKSTSSFSSGRNSYEKGQSSNVSISKSMQEKSLVRTQDVTALKVGEFVGMTVESKQPYFRSSIKVDSEKAGDFSIPPFASGVEAERNFAKIKHEVERFICSYSKRKISFVQTKVRL